MAADSDDCDKGESDNVDPEEDFEASSSCRCRIHEGRQSDFRCEIEGPSVTALN